MADETLMPWEREDGGVITDAPPPPAAAPATAPKAPADAPKAPRGDDAVEALFERISRPAYFSEHLKTMKVDAFDAKESFLADDTVIFSRIGLTDADACTLAAAFEQLQPKTMKYLYLGENEIGDEGFAALVGALVHAPQIECVFLAQNRIGDAVSTAPAARCPAPS